MHKKTLLSIVGLLLSSLSVFSQNDSIDLKAVVITGTRAEVNRNNVPMSISVISREEIEQSSESALLPVLSEQVPGMFVTEKGIAGFGVGSSSAGGIFLRGLGGGNQLLVLINGNPQYMGVMGHHMPDAYVASDVERVEVLRGPASILYGSNAMGGVINIITRQQEKDGYSANARLMYGSYNTQKYMANGGYKKDKFNIFASVNHDRTDGHRENSSFNLTNGYVRAGYQLSQHFNLRADASIAAYETQNPGALTKLMSDNVANILRGVAAVSFENKFEKTNGAVNIFYNFGKHKINDGYAASKGETPKTFLFRSQDFNFGANLYQIFSLFKGNSITAGIDFKSFGGKAYDDFFDANLPNRVWADTSLYEIAGYLTAQQTLFQKLTLNAGLRLENNKAFGTEWVPQAGLAYRPFSQSVLKASVSKGFRSPNIQNLFYSAAWAGHNPNLKPEEMINYEVAIGQGFLDGRLYAELTGFISDAKNIIVTEGTYPNFINQNSGKFKNSGIELFVKYEIMKNLRLQGNYSYLNLEKPMLYSPKHQACVTLYYTWKKFAGNLTYQYINGLYSQLKEGTDEAIINSYGLLNAKLSYQPLKWLNVFAKGENLTDKSYQIINDFPMPRATVLCGVEIKF